MADSQKSHVVAAHVPFYDLCMVMQKVSDTQGKDKKKKIFEKFLEHWRQTHDRMHGGNDTKEDTFFSAMRLFLPSLDKERPSYGMKEVVLAKYYIDVLNIAKESQDAKKLLNYRAPSSAKQDAGDFGAVAYLVLKDRCPDKGNLTMQDVNTCLDAMAQANVEKKRDVMKKEIHKLIRNTSALEQKWLIRMILKELKIGLSENSIFSIFHPDALELYNVCSSLSKVCLDLRDPKLSLSEAEITLFSPFRPMLGQRASFSEVEKLMDHKQFYIETKVDGERIQLHKKGDEYRYFSRGCHDYSESFGTTVFRGTMTPHLHSVFPMNVKSCILDGEMIAYDPNSETFVSKGGNVDIKADTLDGVHPCFVVFDILMINDEKLASLTLKERIEKLESVIKPIPGRLQFVERRDGGSKEQVIAALNDAIDKREEGIVVKHPGSLYKPSKRKGSGWLKIKPDYLDSLSDQLDLLIVGGYFGVGRRGGQISHFLCAVAVPPKRTNDHPSVFHSFCKVGSGYTMKELNDLCNTLHPYWRKYDTKNPPENIILAPGFKEKPDLWIEPSKSKIIQVKAAEITASEKYKCGCTLRFPRVDKIRDDKNWYDCMDTDELQKLRDISGGYLTNKAIAEDDSGEPVRKKKRAVTRVELPRRVAGHLKGADVSTIKEVSSLFEDHEFCVMSGSADLTKHELEKKIAEHGGRFVQNPGTDTHCVIADKVNLRVKNVISRGLLDVVSVSWLATCLDSGEVLEYKPRDMIFTSEKTKEKFMTEYDKHGDSFTDDVTEERLHQIFNDIKDEDKVEIEDDQIAEIEFRYFPNNSKLGLFRRCRAYMDMWSTIGDTTSDKATMKLDVPSLEYQFYGGTVCSGLDDSTTHIIVDKSNTSRLPIARDMIRKIHRKPHIVSEDWIPECIEKERLVEERAFEPF